jgi:hypothetical protein
VKPAGQRILPGQRGGPAGQDEEGRLEGVLGVLLVAQDVPAHAKDHRAVPAHQDGKGCLVAHNGKLLDQGPVGAGVAQLFHLPVDVL